MKQHVWPCSFCPVAERDLPSDFGRDGVNALARIIAHERKHKEEKKNA